MLKLEWSPLTSRFADDFAHDFVQDWNDNCWSNETNWYNAIEDELNCYLDYHEAHWDVLKTYCDAKYANWETAYQALLNDIYSIISEVEEKEEKIC